jgi:hypothetical protein
MKNLFFGSLKTIQLQGFEKLIPICYTHMIILILKRGLIQSLIIPTPTLLFLMVLFHPSHIQHVVFLFFLLQTF